VRRYFREMRYMPKSMITGGLIDMDRHRSSLVGRAFPRLSLRNGDGKPDFDELCGNNFALIGIDVDPGVLKQVAELPLWAKSKPAFFNVLVQSPVGELGFRINDDRQKAMLAPHSGEIAIVRPDRYTAAIASADDLQRRAEFFGRKIGLLPRG
jgi:3-(3-hydroxy-phenyl)propionate hydroxylase